MRGELCAEAIRLGRLLCELMPDDAEVLGLLALMLLHDARRRRRGSTRAGDYVALDEQDRSRWDRDRIDRGPRDARPCAAPAASGPYQLQAAITALHVEAATPRTPTGRRSRSCTARSASSSPSPVVELNRAVAVGFADGPEAGLALLEPLLGDARLERYQPLHAAHAELLRRAGDAARRGRGLRAGDRAEHERGRADRAPAPPRGAVGRRRLAPAPVRAR